MAYSRPGQGYGSAWGRHGHSKPVADGPKPHNKADLNRSPRLSPLGNVLSRARHGCLVERERGPDTLELKPEECERGPEEREQLTGAA